MYKPSTLRKIAASTPGIFVIETLVMGLILIMLFGPHVRHWNIFALYSATLGLIATLFIKLYTRKTFRSIGISSTRQALELKHAVNTNTLPTDKELLDALPAYILKGERQIAKFRKDFRKNLAFFGGFSILSIITHLTWTAVVFPAMIGFTIYAYKSTNKTEERLQALRSTLEKQGIKITPQIQHLQKQEKAHQESKSWVIPS